MTQKSKHAQKSKRSSHNKIPVGMFAMRAHMRKIKKEGRKK